MSNMSIISNLQALGEVIKADNHKTLNPCVLKYKIGFRVKLPELLEYLNEYYKSVQTNISTFQIPNMSNIKTNIGALTKLGVALLHMPKYMEISHTILINSVLSYTIEKKRIRGKRQEQEPIQEQVQEQEQEHVQEQVQEQKQDLEKRKQKIISNNIFAVLDDEFDNDDTKKEEIKVSEQVEPIVKADVPNVPPAPKKQYNSVLKTPIIHTPIKLDLNGDFPSISAPIKAKNASNISTRTVATPVKLNFAEVLSKAPTDEEIAKINKQKRLDAELSKLENQDKLNMLEEIIDFDNMSDSSDSNDKCEKYKETLTKEDITKSWADSDSDDDF
jgi:hypothetical protein